MTITVYPLDAITGAPSYTGRMLRETAAVFLGGATASRPLGIRSGVRPNTPADCFTLTGTTWSLAKAFAGAVDAESAAEAGPYMFAINGTNTGSTAAADASNPRKDILCLLISDNAEDSLGAASGTLVYTSGVAAASPTQPATPARSIPLLRFDVPKSGTGAPTMTWIAPMLVTPGVIPIFATSTERDSLFSNPQTDDLSRLVTERFVRRWNGSSWKPFGTGSFPLMPTSVAGTGAVLNADGSITCTAVSSVSVNGIGTTDFDINEVELDGPTTSASLSAALRLRAAGSDLAGSVYDSQALYAQGTSAAAAAAAAGSNWGIGIGGTIHRAKISLTRLVAAAAKIGDSKWYSTQNPQTSPTLYLAGLQYRTASAVDGYSIIFTGGTFTGTIYNFGLSKE